MGEKIVVGPFNRGIKTDREPFYIDNDSFPVLINAYQWRGRIKRKRGTSLLGRLRRFFNSASTSYGSTTSFNLVGGAGNLLTGFSLETNGNIFPTSVTFTDATAGNVYTDPAGDGVLVGAPGGSGTINYATGAITVSGGAANLINTASFNYYPTLPVLGLEELVLGTNLFPESLGFDSKYSYNIVTTGTNPTYDVSFYKNPITGTYSGYTQKTTVTPTSWNGQNYQQFWTCNYQGALWATNGVTDPFVTTNVGMQYKAIVTVTVVTPTSATLQITGHGLVIGDFLFINEVSTTTGINFQTGFVTGVPDANNVTVSFPNATIATNGTGGIAQYLTSRSDTTRDCLRWYDGDPTDGDANNPVLDGRKGWVNFAPPLSNLDYSIADLPADQYYLVGARMIVPFKDRLLFFGPVIQTSTANSQVYLQDTVIFSQNGTPYYTASFSGSVTSAATTYNAILVPNNQTSTGNAFFEDLTGYGGYLSAGVSVPMITVEANEDVLIVGFANLQSRLVYTGNDVQPFNLYVINSELGSTSTFSSINFDRGVASIGDRGLIMTSQVETKRIDLEIPDQIFQFNLRNNGSQRISAARDFISEWIYFSYLSNSDNTTYPNQTLQYNYRDETWSIFNESYTTYGIFQKVDGNTWSTIGQKFPTWASWTEPWNAGASTLLQQQVIAGNQQGFIVYRNVGTNESNSLYIRSFSGATITSPDHGLSNNDFIVISGCLGTVSSEVNGEIFKVFNVSQNSFDISVTTTGTYLGAGLIKRMYRPLIQSKQFPMGWGLARKTRLGPQQYLLTGTDNGQITLQIYLSTDDSSPYNFGPVVPSPNSQNNSLVFTDILYTCPESTNLGLTAANINLNMVSAIAQQQIWHRINTSLLGDTVQVGFTLSDEQMMDEDFNNQFSEIELHGFILDVSPSMVLA